MTLDLKAVGKSEIVNLDDIEETKLAIHEKKLDLGLNSLTLDYRNVRG